MHYKPSQKYHSECLIQHPIWNYKHIKKIKCFGSKKFPVFDFRNFVHAFQVVVFCCEKIFKIPVKKPNQGIKRIQKPHINMLHFVKFVPRRVWKNSHYITLFNIAIPVLNIRIGVVQTNVSLYPNFAVTSEQFQNITKKSVLFFGKKNGIVSCVMKGIYKDNNHRKPHQDIEQKQQRSNISEVKNTSIKDKK